MNVLLPLVDSAASVQHGRLRRSCPRPGDKWYLDEVFIRILGVRHSLWRAVGPDGVALDILVQPRRDA